MFTVDVLTPRLPTAMLACPDRLVYLSSGVARGGVPCIDDPQWTTRSDGLRAFGDSKLLEALLAFGAA